MIALKEGNIEAVKTEIAEHIAGFSVYLARFRHYFSTGKKIACYG
jgi:hypothetical protein